MCCRVNGFGMIIELYSGQNNKQILGSYKIIKLIRLKSHTSEVCKKKADMPNYELRPACQSYLTNTISKKIFLKLCMCMTSSLTTCILVITSTINLISLVHNNNRNNNHGNNVTTACWKLYLGN